MGRPRPYGYPQGDDGPDPHEDAEDPEFSHKAPESGDDIPSPDHADLFEKGFDWNKSQPSQPSALPWANGKRGMKRPQRQVKHKE